MLVIGLGIAVVFSAGIRIDGIENQVGVDMLFVNMNRNHRFKARQVFPGKFRGNLQRQLRRDLTRFEGLNHMVILDAVLLSISPLGIQHLPNLPAWVAVQVDGEESVRFFFVEDVSDTVRQRPLPGQNFCDGDLCRLPSQKIRATSLRGGSQMNRYSMPNSLHRFSNLAFSFSFTALERSFMQW